MNTSKSFTELLERLGVTFSDEQLLKTAFAHRSYLNEAGKDWESNERLEFLGDAILAYVVSAFLYRKYPEQPEGVLTNMRSTMVKTGTLASIAEELNFGSYLYLSKGELESGGASNPSLLADTFEAFLGALYLDQGLAAAEEFLNRILLARASQILDKQLNSDYKSKLQEIVQTFSRVAPTYRVTKTEGPDHAKTFWVAVVVDGMEKETGTGQSKQEAEQDAAAKTLEKMGKL